MIRTARLLLVIAITVGLGTLAWPAEFGGRTSYVITEGISMLPRFRADGLVITRSQERYQVGEVVAYRNRKLNAVVMHRIVARAGERYVMKGDNNEFRDRYRPSQRDIVGKEWAYWPNIGQYLAQMRSPTIFGGFAALAAFLCFRSVPSRRRRSHHAR